MAHRLNNLKLMLKSLFYQGNWNYENMQGTGFNYLLNYVNKMLGLNIDRCVLRKSSGYFNTNPYLITFMLGIWCKEYRKKSDTDYVKRIYAPALAALGDRFFWHTLKPLSFLISAFVCFYSPILAFIIYLTFFNSFHLFFLYKGYDIGFYYGRNTINWFNRIRFSKWSVYAEYLMLFLIGILLARVCRIYIDGVNISIISILMAIFLITILVVKKLPVVLTLFIFTALILINIIVMEFLK
jgi:mannose/fructose/N-acetylgalactosamine-specific phosphotransferase system component IID